MVIIICCLKNKKKPPVEKPSVVELEEAEKENLINYRVEGGQERDEVKLNQALFYFCFYRFFALFAGKLRLLFVIN